MASFPGTAIYIQLPKGFVWNETAMGFYKEEDGSVIKYNEFKKCGMQRICRRKKRWAH